MNLFGRNKQSEDEDDEENDFEESPESKKPIFGFQCSPAIHVSAKALAKELHMDL